MKIIGLTGGIASGKSTVSAYLKQKGAVIIDADAIAHKLLEPNAALWLAYIGHFGRQYLREDNTLDTRAIGKIVFASVEEQAWINAIAQPIIKSAIETAIAKAKNSNAKIIILDVPLLFETGWEKLADSTCLVYVDKKQQLSRLIQRNGYSEDEAMARIGAQMSMSAKRKLADRIIDNGGTLKNTYRQADILWEEWGRD